MSTDNRHEAATEAVHPASTGSTSWASSAANEVWAAGHKLEDSAASAYHRLTGASSHGADDNSIFDREKPPTNPAKVLWDEITDLRSAHNHPQDAHGGQATVLGDVRTSANVSGASPEHRLNANVTGGSEATVGGAISLKELMFGGEKGFDALYGASSAKNITGTPEHGKTFGFVKTADGQLFELDKTAPGKLDFHEVALVKDGPNHYKAEPVKRYLASGGEVTTDAHPVQHIETAKAHVSVGDSTELQNIHGKNHATDSKVVAKAAPAAAKPSHVDLANPYADPNFF